MHVYRPSPHSLSTWRGFVVLCQKSGSERGGPWDNGTPLSKQVAEQLVPLYRIQCVCSSEKSASWENPEHERKSQQLDLGPLPKDSICWQTLCDGESQLTTLFKITNNLIDIHPVQYLTPGNTRTRSNDSLKYQQISIRTNCSLNVTRGKKKFHQQYTLHGQTLKPVSSTRYLGVTLTSDATWETHIIS